MSQRLSIISMVGAAAAGAAIAFAALTATGGVRGPEQARLLTLVLVAVPALLVFAWILTRRSEWRLALAACAALYFFAPFVAARIESLLDPIEAATVGRPHLIYFFTLIGLHLLSALALTFWRSRHVIVTHAPAPVRGDAE